MKEIKMHCRQKINRTGKGMGLHKGMKSSENGETFAAAGTYTIWEGV